MHGSRGTGHGEAPSGDGARSGARSAVARAAWSGRPLGSIFPAPMGSTQLARGRIDSSPFVVGAEVTGFSLSGAFQLFDGCRTSLSTDETGRPSNDPVSGSQPFALRALTEAAPGPYSLSARDSRGERA